MVQKALSPAPEDRYPTTDDFARALLTELTRLGGPPSKRQVGEWVKLKCSEAWETNQRLLSRISTLKRVVETQQVTDDALAPTLTQQKPAPMVAPLSTDAAIAALRPSQAPLIVALTVLALAGAAGVWWMMHRPDGERVPMPMPTPTTVVVPPPVVQVQALDAGEVKAPPEPVDAGTPAPAEEHNPAAETPAPVVSLTHDAGKTTARLRATIQWTSAPQRAMQRTR